MLYRKSQSILFFSGIFLFVWLAVDPRLIYHSFGMIMDYPEFSTGWLFFKEVLSEPAGPIRYLAGFLSQWFYYSWIGAVIVTALAWSMYFLSGTLVAVSGGRRNNILCYLPAIGVLVMYAGYNHPLSMSLAMATTILFAVVYAKIPFSNNVFACGVLVGLAIVLYYIAGGASLFFPLLVAACEVVARRRIRFALLCVVLGAAVIGLVMFFFVDTPLQQAWSLMLPFHQEISRNTSRLTTNIVISLYAYVFLLIWWTGLWQRIITRKASSKQTHQSRKRKSQKKDTAPPLLSSGRFMQLIQSLLLVGITVAAVSLSYDRNKKLYLTISRFAQDKNWHDVLSTTQKSPRAANNVFCNHDINRALYHTGRLGWDMFEYKQHPSALLLMIGMQKQSLIRNLKGIDIFIELGDLNFAEQLAYEVLELKGDSPHILDALARINMIKGQTETARFFLTALSMNPIYDNHAERLIEHLDSDPDLTSDEKTMYLRKCMLIKDQPALDYNEEFLLQELLQKYRGNRMAFEYMMTFYLLTGQHKKISENITHFRDMGYEKIPRCYEEAILLHIAMSGNEPNMHGWTISSETMKRYEAFNSVGRNPAYNHLSPDQIKEILAKNFSDSYFFYYLFTLQEAR